jgi:ketosteroid isomerase-like protein
MKSFFPVLFSLFFLQLSFTGFAQDDPDLVAIKQIMERQVSDWNRGDKVAFMVGYWESDQLKFIGSKGVVYGYKATLERYNRSYPDQATMGTLKFEYISMEKMGKKIAFVVGKFHLTRPEKGDAEGHFSLLWKKIGGKWVIVADHSS